MGIGCRLLGVETATLAQEAAHSRDVWKGTARIPPTDSQAPMKLNGTRVLSLFD